MVELQQFISLYQFPSGRATFAVRASRAAAEALGEAALVARCDTVLTQAEATRSLEVRHRLAASGVPLYGPEANALDASIDRTLTALRGAITARAAIVDGDGDGDPVGAAAKRLDDELFPRGVGFITSMNYVEEHAWVDTVLARLRGAGDLAEAATLLGLDAYVARLEALNARFGEELAKARPKDAVTWDVVRGERAKMQAALLRLVAASVGRFVDDEDAAGRDAVLGPILKQQEALAASYRTRRGMRDVDPQTGVEEGVEALVEPGPTGEA